MAAVTSYENALYGVAYVMRVSPLNHRVGGVLPCFPCLILDLYASDFVVSRFDLHDFYSFPSLKLPYFCSGCVVVSSCFFFTEF